jgi:hypothetical protein
LVAFLTPLHAWRVSVVSAGRKSIIAFTESCRCGPTAAVVGLGAAKPRLRDPSGGEFITEHPLLDVVDRLELGPGRGVLAPPFQRVSQPVPDVQSVGVFVAEHTPVDVVNRLVNKAA